MSTPTLPQAIVGYLAALPAPALRRIERARPGRWVSCLLVTSAGQRCLLGHANDAVFAPHLTCGYEERDPQPLFADELDAALAFDRMCRTQGLEAAVARVQAAVRVLLEVTR